MSVIGFCLSIVLFVLILRAVYRTEWALQLQNNDLHLDISMNCVCIGIIVAFPIEICWSNRNDCLFIQVRDYICFCSSSDASYFPIVPFQKIVHAIIHLQLCSSFSSSYFIVLRTTNSLCKTYKQRVVACRCPQKMEYVYNNIICSFIHKLMYLRVDYWILRSGFFDPSSCFNSGL